MILRYIFLLFIPFHLFGQFTETFSDGDFTNNPEWIGNTAQFEILDGQLHLNDTEANEVYLSTAVATLDMTTWEFFVNLDFNPSTSNLMKVFIKSNVSDLSGDLNGYFIRIGEIGSEDGVDLYKQTGGSSSKIIDGTSNNAGETPSMYIKVTRDNDGNWELFTDATDSGTNYISEGTTNDSDHNLGSYMGISCKYTVSNNTNFYFDDFFVDPIYVDDAPPQIVSTSTTSQTDVQVVFSEPVDPSTAENTANYTVEGVGNPTSATIDPSNPAIVILTFADNFPVNQNLTLTVMGISDPSGNTLTNGTGTFVFSVAASRDVIFNEFFPDPEPAVGLPEEEFIELYNRTVVDIDISDWLLSDESTFDAPTTLPEGTIIPANGYLILCKTTQVETWGIFGTAIGVTSFPSLNNSEDVFRLQDAFGNIIDEVAYSIDWYADENKVDGGWTLEMIDPNFPCSIATNWRASQNTSGGTPGTVNSVAATLPPDQIPPTLNSATYSCDQSITLELSEALETSGALTISNYSIQPQLDISSISTTGNKIVLSLITTPIVGTTYNITINDVADCSGNIIVNNTVTLSDNFPPVIESIQNICNQGIIIQFSEPIDEYTASFPANYTLIPTTEIVQVVVLDEDRVTLVLGEGLIQDSAYMIEIQNVTDCFGNEVASTNLQFQDTEDPTLLSGELNCAESLTLLFSEGLAGSLSEDPALYTIEPSISISQVNVSVSEMTIFFGDDIAPDVEYTLTISDAVTDCYGNPIVNPTFTFEDGTPPDLWRAETNGTQFISLFFSETIEETSALNIANYTISPSVSIVQAAFANNQVTLFVEQELQEGTLYTITANNITDCLGNVIGLFNSAEFGLSEDASSRDVIINEILFNPITGGFDYVELYNRTDKFIDLSPWKIGNLASGFLLDFATDSLPVDDLVNISDVPLSIAPNDYLVLTANPVWVLGQYGTCHQLEASKIVEVNLPTYSTSEGMVGIIRSGQSDILDKVQYTADWHYPLLDNEKGVALERINPDGLSQDANNWHSASNTSCFGTPGLVNSQFFANPGDLSQNIGVSPKVFSPDGDGFQDFTQISYAFDEPGYTINITVFDDEGRKIRRLIQNEFLGESGAYTWNGLDDNGERVLLGIYIIYVEAFNLDGDVTSFKETCVVGGNLD